MKPVGFAQHPDGTIAVEVDQVARGLDGTIAVEVDQVARGLDGTPLGEKRVLHVYTFGNDLVARMDVEQLARVD